MKNPIALLCAVLVIFTISMTGVGIRDLKGQAQNRDDYIAVRDALRHGGLREAAKLKGHYIGEFDPHWDFGRFDIEWLTKNSAAVVVGVVSRDRGGHLTESGMVILTDYEVVIQEVIKGEILEGAKVIVSLSGGRVQFEDGTTAELRTPTFEHVKQGGAYTFFLSEVKKSPGTYTLTGGPQGLVEIENNTSVKSHGRSTDPIATETKDLSKDSFLKEVHEQARKWPYPGKCCS